MSDIYSISDDALEVLIEDREARLGTAQKLLNSGYWTEVVPALDRIAVSFDPRGMPLEVARRELASQITDYQIDPIPTARHTSLPVRYGGDFGPDLEMVASALGMSADDIIDLHIHSIYTVDMIGFTPGFAYMGGLAPELDVPRLESPRQRVPAGSVGIVSGFTGLYSLSGPGGWPIIGQTDATLFSARREKPFLLRPGDQVSFTRIGS